jgi:sirohydrochlorin cobaltochelatase
LNTVIVLAMHGTPPKDFPRQEMSEWFGLHGQMEHARGTERSALEKRYAELDAKMRGWPRTVANDPFRVNSLELAAQVRQMTGLPVIVGFNEFCAPTLAEALEQAIRSGAEKVVVVTPMMTRGGEHAERDIPAAIEQVQREHSGVQIVYAWPFDLADVAGFLVQRVRREVTWAASPVSRAEPGRAQHSTGDRRR